MNLFFKKIFCCLGALCLASTGMAQESSTQNAPENLPKDGLVLTPSLQRGFEKYMQSGEPGQANNPDPVLELIRSDIPQRTVNTPSASVPASSKFERLDNPKGNLWQRIRQGFLMPDLQNEHVTNREQWFKTKPEYIAKVTEQAKKYLYHIVEELEARNMPLELALLPFVESAFNPHAVSPAKAAGMWQFIPSTGKQYDLKQNTFRDDRRDVLASTRAALDYLQKLYVMFNDWHLALAAYNWGEGSVRRAIARNQQLGLPTSYLDLKMPRETQHYVPKLQAFKNIISNPELFNARLHPIDNHPYFRSVPVTRDMDVQLVARLAQVPLHDFKALNPSLARPVILAAGTPQVLMPWENADIFSANLESYKGQLASWTAWVTPISLKPAEAARRFGMSENALREANGIASKAGVIKAGSTLLVTRPTHKQEDVAPSLADNGQLTLMTMKPVPKSKSKTIAAQRTIKKGRTTAAVSAPRSAKKPGSARNAVASSPRKTLHAQK